MYSYLVVLISFGLPVCTFLNGKTIGAYHVLPETFPRILATCLGSFQMKNWICKSYSRIHTDLLDFGTAELSEVVESNNNII